ncbi:uncharacterized protein L969DRAFT_89445 [Mixia osmundae IAM 14324]|nr:uncharacterized protein L969DRAFT_89445 [Mixia osmundae IAM 14324]KEI37495.1 hypothetical protein L969DRAFT_89445 [Mixia osmundae IAM 14324]
MQKTGQVDKTEDREFQDEVNKFKIMEKNTLALQKEAKAHLDAMRGMTANQARIAGTLEAFFVDNGEAAMAGHSYRRAVEELDTRTTQGLDQPYRATVLEPIGKLCSYFPEVNNTIQKRNKKLLDHDSTRTNVRKLQDKPPTDGSKLPMAEKAAADAKDVYEAINTQLVSELPQLIEYRIPYLDPSFESMVRMQAQFASEAYEKLGGVQRYFADDVRDLYANGDLDGQVEGALQEIRDLTICGS